MQDESPPDTVAAALLYLMTQYALTGCPRLALYIARHMQYLALHPEASPVLRDICASLRGPWQEASEHHHPAPGVH